MRSSQVLFRRSRSLLQSSASTLVKTPRRPPGRPPRLPRNDPSPQSSTSNARLSSTATPSPPAAETPNNPSETPEDALPEPPESEEPPTEESEKPKTRRARITVTREPDVLQLPEDLDILWTPDSEPQATIDDSSLPPEDMLDEALHNLHIALHPQTQHKSIYASGATSIEPSLALYCPLEGGNYVIDATVRELARRADAEVVELDAIHLAGGEWGHFGKAGSAIQLPENPLHFPSSPSTPTSAPRPRPDDDEDDSSPQIFSSPQQMMLTLMTSSSPSSSGRPVVSAPSRRSASPSKTRVFFDALVNLPSKQHVDTQQQPSTSSSSTRRPRIIYLKDFQTIEPSSAAWFPAFLSAVRQRRRGPISRPLSPVSNPTVIIFGITPPLVPNSTSHPSGPAGIINMLMNKHSQSSPPSPHPRSGKSEWAEDSTADKARERRLRERMRKWEQGDPTHPDEVSKLVPGSFDAEGKTKPEIVIVGASQSLSNLPFLPSFLRGSSGPSEDLGKDDADDAFFRTSFVLPRRRMPSIERDHRMARRRETNELIMRMGIGAVGGVIDGPIPFAQDDPNSSTLCPEQSEPDSPQIWESWGQQIETWPNIQQISDRAIGSTLASYQPSERTALDPTVVSWDVVQSAWNYHQARRRLRKSWAKEFSSGEAAEAQQDEDAVVGDGVDEVVERIKSDPELDPHEQRLLASIVESSSMPTSFSQVHLPPHTIDSVRTIVSLPLLYPSAFQQGILKDHAMTGCLLFGPPGTGKTLVVRALAKEAGCRMMVISPSDVMDMYVGEGEKLVKAVFSLARKLSPCVVFLDEIDALFGARMSARESGGAFAHRGVITEFMQEMDGLKTSRENSVVVIGATNRPFDLDDAILRRLPRRLLVDLPGEKEREEILKILLRDENLAEDVNPHLLAKRTESFSGSDLKHLCVSAALDAVKETVQVPWAASKTDIPASGLNQHSPLIHDTTNDTVAPLVDGEPQIDPTSPTEADPEAKPVLERTLALRNFDKALKEITPSSSESLGTLSDLRKWNDEFGEGRKDRKKVHVWGKGRFGFINQDSNIEEGKVSAPATRSHIA
ncbi:hypothetical protein ONZ45_g2750 [Pleurotus djamor]|nr:hypothetical protein ONZ45_g2750 [Pleurotus djamor]